MSENAGGCCRCCCSFIFTLGLTSLFMWLSLRTSNPKCSIQAFYLPALDKSSNNRNNTTLQFQLKLENTNKDKGVYYDDVNVTVYDFPNRSHIIGTSVIGRFYQGHKKTAHKNGTAPTDQKVVSRAVFANGSAVFRVDLVTAVRFKIIAWKTKRHKIAVGADVEVNVNGTKVNKKNIKLSSSGSNNVSYYCCCVGILLYFFVLIFA